jgi:hypothetical protein
VLPGVFVRSHRSLASAPSWYDFGYPVRQSFCLILLLHMSTGNPYSTYMLSHRVVVVVALRIRSGFALTDAIALVSPPPPTPQSSQKKPPVSELYVPPASPYPEAIVAVFKWGSSVAMCCCCELGQLGLRQQRTVLTTGVYNPVSQWTDTLSYYLFINIEPWSRRWPALFTFTTRNDLGLLRLNGSQLHASLLSAIYSLDLYCTDTAKPPD